MNYNSLSIYFKMFAVNLPPLIVCLGACGVILSMWKRELLWALLGFGLGLFISIGAPISQAYAQSWVVQTGNVANYTWIFAALGGFWSLLHACVYVLLFVASIEAGKKSIKQPPTT
jgi:hypothetical protein